MQPPVVPRLSESHTNLIPPSETLTMMETINTLSTIFGVICFVIIVLFLFMVYWMWSVQHWAYMTYEEVKKLNARMASNSGNTSEPSVKARVSKPRDKNKIWACSCGRVNNPGSDCAECGAKWEQNKILKTNESSDTDDFYWQCECGKKNTKYQAKQCIDCGKSKP